MANPQKRAQDHRPADVRPVRLEKMGRRGGGWLDVFGFDAADTPAADAVRRSTLNLCRVGGGAWRIVTDCQLPQVIEVLLDAGRGWQPYIDTPPTPGATS